jgi:hypothetical protein
MTNDSMELFGEQDFDQKKLEKEASLRPAVVIEKRKEKTPEEQERENVAAVGRGKVEEMDNIRPTLPSSGK